MTNNTNTNNTEEAKKVSKENFDIGVKMGQADKQKEADKKADDKK